MKVFLSHAALDRELAEFIEKQLRLTDPPPDVFRTTRVGQIPAGREWLAFIQKNLKEADRYLVLLTPWSMSRPWIAFETGAAWYSERPLVPVTAGGLTSSELVEPFRSLQVLSLENPAEAAEVFSQLDCRLGDPTAFCSAVLSFAAKAKLQALALDDWTGIEFEGHFYSWEGPIEALVEGQPRPLPVLLIKALEDQGLQLTTAVPGNLDGPSAKGYTVVWLIDLKHRRRHHLLSRDRQVLLAKPEGLQVG